MRHLRLSVSNLRRLVARAPIVALGVCFLAGILFWGGFHWTLELTNTEAFCISCHEMKDNVYREYRKTIHFSNPAGVRATCPDCHVPKEWAFKVMRKIHASNELLQHFLGTVDTREKFVAKRLSLATQVWDTMRGNNSRECRNCHDFSYMNLKAQKGAAADKHRRAYDKHRQAFIEQRTCIDCHQGVAHSLPEEFLEQEHARFERDKVPCGDCHADMARAASNDGW